MNVIPVIGSSLKSDDIIELLEHWDAEVVYEFDRLHENTPDSYRVTAHTAGIELLFDDCQVLTTAFLRVLPSDGFSPFDFENSDIQVCWSIQEARGFAASSRVAANEGSATFLGTIRDWIKLKYKTHTVHYEFIGDRLNLVTVALEADVTHSAQPEQSTY